ncbi:cell wall hydrolase [Bacillus infantis]|uniref:cell wall hydrolase n=1 Tax=Bacillus infantis TaxID=324767 RepID=UPI0030176D52
MKYLALMIAAFMLISFQLVQNPGKQAFAKTIDNVDIYTVKEEDSLSKLSRRFGVAAEDIQKANYKKDEKIFAGDKLIIPSAPKKKKRITEQKVSLSKGEKDLLARLVHAEAKGEPHAGKVAVAEVVLNRMKDEKFPDTVKEVIYEDRQFEPVDNGMINKPAGKDSQKAVQEALTEERKDGESLFFFNPDQTNSKWLRTRAVTKEIGNHRFAK